MNVSNIARIYQTPILLLVSPLTVAFVAFVGSRFGNSVTVSPDIKMAWRSFRRRIIMKRVVYELYWIMTYVLMMGCMRTFFLLLVSGSRQSRTMLSFWAKPVFSSSLAIRGDISKHSMNFSDVSG